MGARKVGQVDARKVSQVDTIFGITASVLIVSAAIAISALAMDGPTLISNLTSLRRVASN